VLNMRLATTESYLDKDKVRRERTDWHNVVVWGKRGEALAKILTKGSSIFVEGSIRTSSYDDRDGNKRYKTEIIANNILLTGGRGRGGGAPAEDAGGYTGGGYEDAGGYTGGGGGYARQGGGGRPEGGGGRRAAAGGRLRRQLPRRSRLLRPTTTPTTVAAAAAAAATTTSRSDRAGYRPQARRMASAIPPPRWESASRWSVAVAFTSGGA
jgi:single-stranded DNA-binding protein